MNEVLGEKPDAFLPCLYEILRYLSRIRNPRLISGAVNSQKVTEERQSLWILDSRISEAVRIVSAA